MSETLVQRAAKAWAAVNYVEAFRLYQELANSGESFEQILAFQNGGACLRRLGKLEEAVSFLMQGILQHPNAPGIHHNLGNCLRDIGGKQRWQALVHYRKAEQLGLNSEDRVLSQAHLWSDLGYPGQALACLIRWQSAKGEEARPNRIDVIQLLLELATKLFEADEADPIASWCLDRLNGIGLDNPINQLALAVSCARLARVDEALEAYKKCLAQFQHASKSQDTQERQTLINGSWNLACSLLKAGEMQAGWELYEYGLQAPAKPPQRWQRAFPKLFSQRQIPIWRGEPLAGKQLLLIGEQAIGDTMMFLRLLPELQKQQASVTLAIQDRLLPIYQRSYPDLPVVAADASLQGTAHWLKASNFDVQISCGSLPQHCLNTWIHHGDHGQQLISDPGKAAHFRELYRQDLRRDLPVIGISWLGGGRSERIRMKSLPLEDFTSILTTIPARFVSVQYGEVQSQVQRWQQQGIDVIHSQEVDALKDMDTWLAQVSACDLVISVANTTIHGAGALGIPTLCLLSRNSDWRWVEGMPHSYWYNSVECTLQDRRGSWQAAIDATIGWVQTNWPEPKPIPRDISPLKFVHTLRQSHDDH